MTLIRHSLCVVLLLLLCGVLFFFRLGDRDLWSSHEARAAQNARGILDDGNWLIPRLFDGRPELQKPPLYYWLVASASMMVGEVNSHTVRLPSALAATLTVAAVFLVFAVRGRPASGLLAAAILATCVRFTWLARVGRIDMPLTAAVAVTLCSFLVAGEMRHRGARYGTMLVAYLAGAVAVFLKGPIGLVLPGVVVAVWWFLPPTRPAARLAVQHALWGLPLILALVLPWTFAANRATDGQFFLEFLWKHNFQRGLGGDDQLDGHVHPPWFYLGRIWLDAFPWSLLVIALPLISRFTQQDDIPKPQPKFSTWAWAGLIWFLAIFCFLSLMKYKRPDYLLPAYPGLAIFLGEWFATRWAYKPSAVRRWLGGSLIVAACAVVAGWVGFVSWYLPLSEPQRELRTFAAAVRTQAGKAPVLLFRVEVHQMTWNLGRPVERLWEWENLDIWAVGDQPLCVLTRPEWASVWEQHLEAGRLVELFRTPPGHAEELVLLITEPPPNAPASLAEKSVADRHISSPHRR